ncbi:hypothetical protein QYE76_011799 [Lolium multiflorum]|uniref:Retrotransposon Copia-like N-terminal domain-containing protein n=1 Tax=Lolium multiflorum TaxID=4521 RepID=A0AAD8X5N5_LOLMU|nr:hypothetical protein QYE76_011799 [Lolium multiflorum]
MSSSSSTSGLATALGSPPTQVLTRSNYLLWQALIVPAFRGANVMGLLDGSDRAPAKIIEVEDSEKKKIQVENSAYVAWIARDQLVLRFLRNSLSPEILSHVLDMDTTAAAWAGITSMFKTASRTKAQHLREMLNDTKKLIMTADQYFTKMKGFASELSALGKPIGDDELLGYLLHGLDKGEYNSLITSVNGNNDTTIDGFYEQLCGYDMRNGIEENGCFVSSANLARCGYDRPRGRTPPRRSSPPRGRSPDIFYRGGGGGVTAIEMMTVTVTGAMMSAALMIAPGAVMMIAVEIGVMMTAVEIGVMIAVIGAMMVVDGVLIKKRDDAEKAAHLAAAHLAAAPYGVDTNWYADSGATDHITNELSKLLIANKYNGQDKVRTAEGTDDELGVDPEEDPPRHSPCTGQSEEPQPEKDPAVPALRVYSRRHCRAPSRVSPEQARGHHTPSRSPPPSATGSPPPGAGARGRSPGADDVSDSASPSQSLSPPSPGSLSAADVPSGSSVATTAGGGGE